MAFCAISAAMGTVVMLLGGIVPIFTYCSPLLASLFLVPAMELYGKGAARAVWCVTGVLSLIIGIDKEAAFFYLFFSWYPILKPSLDRISPKPVGTGAKVLIFSLAAGVMYYLTCFILGIEEIVESFSGSVWINIAFLAGIVLCMMLFDRALEGIVPMLRGRLMRKGR